MPQAVLDFFDNGGSDAWIVRVGTAPAPEDLVGDGTAGAGLHALDSVDHFNLLILPEAEGDRAVTEAAVALCERRRAVFLTEPPSSVATAADAHAWITDAARVVRHPNAAAYFPRLRAPSRGRDGSSATCPVSGAVAGVYARIDSERGVWKAPAGTGVAVRSRHGLAVSLTDSEQGLLNPLGLNVVRQFPDGATLVWGARTLASGVEAGWNYVPVRRMALFIEESLRRGLQWVVFEPNAEPLWAQVRLTVGAFLHGLFRDGAFHGSSPQEAYFVECDSTTTTEDDVLQGVVNLVVGFAPLRPAEFVVLRIRQSTRGAPQ